MLREFIAKLSALELEHGDLPVFTAGEMGWDTIQGNPELHIVDELVPWDGGEDYADWKQIEALQVGSKFIGIL